MQHERSGDAHRVVGGRQFDAGGRIQNFLFVTQDRSTWFIAESRADVLRAANDFLGCARYRWHHAEGLSALRDISVPDLADTVLVLIGGSQEPWLVSEPDARLLKAHLRNVGHLCAVGAGIFLPLSAGLLNGRQISVHPNFITAASEISMARAFSGTAVTHERHLSSATGPVAAAAMIVNSVGLNAGTVVERSLAAHLEDCLTIRQIAALMPSSPRHLERCCQVRLGLSPIRKYRSLQLWGGARHS